MKSAPSLRHAPLRIPSAVGGLLKAYSVAASAFLRANGVESEDFGGAWQKQETTKGGRTLAGTAYGGWGFHVWRIGGFDYRYTAAEAAGMVADGSVTNSPVFNRGYGPMLSPDATGDEVMYALAKYVPAVSSPVGGRLVFSDVINESFNLVDGKYRANGWCRPSSDDSSLWKHSDIKDAAYFYVYKLYDEIIQKGMLK